MAKIDRHLNLVLPVETAVGDIWVHSTPVSRAVFERYFLVLGRAFAMTFQVGGGLFSGPRIAALSLREAAKGVGVWEGQDGVERGLMPEIHRLTNVVVPAPQGGWQVMTLSDAQAGKVIDEDDFAEVEGAIVFFTLASLMQPKEALAATTVGMQSLWGAQTSSLNCTAFAASLPISTETDNSGETAII
jgi:hypothetical protein